MIPAHLSALLSRNVKIEKPAPIVESYQSIMRKDTQRNNRITMQSIIEESNIDSHELDSIENDSFFESFE